MNFWMIFGVFWEEIVFLKRVVKSREVRRNEVVMCLSFNLVYGHPNSPLPTCGALG